MKPSTSRFLWQALLAFIAILSVGASANAQSFAYVANGGSNGVTVINTSTNAVVTNVTVGNSPQIPAATPDGSLVYVSNWGDNDVSVIGTATNTVLATIPVGVNPYAVAVSPNGALVYVSNDADDTLYPDSQITIVLNRTRWQLIRKVKNCENKQLRSGSFMAEKAGSVGRHGWWIGRDAFQFCRPRAGGESK